MHWKLKSVIYLIDALETKIGIKYILEKDRSESFYIEQYKTTIDIYVSGELRISK